MNETNPWVLPDSTGTTVLTIRADPQFMQALREFTQQENKLYAEKIGYATVVTNLATRDTLYMRNIRSRLNKRYNQLKEQSHGKRKYFDIKDGK